MQIQTSPAAQQEMLLFYGGKLVPGLRSLSQGASRSKSEPGNQNSAGRLGAWSS